RVSVLKLSCLLRLPLHTRIALSLAHARSLARSIQLSQLRGKVRNRSGRSPAAANDRSRDNLRKLRWPFAWPRGHFRSQILLNRASKTTRLGAVNILAQYSYERSNRNRTQTSPCGLLAPTSPDS